MDGLLDVLNTNEGEDEFSFKDFIVPLTTAKAITWIVIIGFIIFSNALFGQFVGDDIENIVNNPFVHNPGNIISVFFSPYELAQHIVRFYRPFLFSIYTLSYTIFG